MATFYIDLVNGNDASAGTSWATAWKTFTNGATAARIAPGDEIRVAKTADPTSIGNATWTNLSSTVTLATAQTATIDNCETAWTAANTATVTRVTTSPIKQGTYAAQIVTPAATATSTLYAYFTVGGASGLDLSTYQQITFWFYNATSAVADANRYQIRLCSDTAGVTAVDTFNIPAVSSTGQWVPLVITKTGGGNLGNAIKSIALYTGTSTPGNTQTIRLDNFSASTTNGLNLTSLLSKNSTADFTLNDGWWALGSIDGTTVTLGGTNNTAASAYRGYYTEGTTPETVTTYIRSTYNTAMASATGTTIESINDSGTSGNLITFTGGWDTTSNTRTGMTFMDGQNGLGTLFLGNARNYIKLEYFGMVRYSNGYTDSTGYNNVILQYIYGVANAVNTINNFSQFPTLTSIFCTFCLIGPNNATCTNPTLTDITSYSSNVGGIVAIAPYLTGSNLKGSNNQTYGLSLNISSGTLTNITAKYNTTNGFILSGTYNNIYSVTSTNNTGRGISLSGQSIYIYGYTSSSNSNSIQLLNNSMSNIRLNNWAYSEATPVVFAGTNIVITELGADYINSNALGAYYYLNGSGTTSTFTAIEQTTTTKPGTGSAWQINVLNTIHNATLPAKLPVAKIAVNSGTAVTVKAWVKKSHATDISASLVIPKLNILGVSNDVVANKSNDTNWEELTVSFTPTVSGVAEVQLWSWSTTGSTTNSTFIDSMTVTQV